MNINTVSCLCDMVQKPYHYIGMKHYHVATYLRPTRSHRKCCVFVYNFTSLKITVDMVFFVFYVLFEAN